MDSSKSFEELANLVNWPIVLWVCICGLLIAAYLYYLTKDER
ncbi:MULTISPECIES: hypothetical protein [Vibrio]|nr:MULTISPECIES: hypothetical protein [Vibrio]